MDLIYYTANGLNGFDSLGHYLRALLLVTNCVDYRVTPLSGCDANWASETTSGAPRSTAELPTEPRNGGAAGALEAQPGETNEIPLPGPEPVPEAPEAPESPVEPLVPPTTEPPATPDAPPDADEAGEGGTAGEQTLRTRMRAARTLLDFLMENGA